MDLKKVALVGVSGYGDIYYKYLFESAVLNKIKLSAAVIINPDEVQDKIKDLVNIGCRIYPDTKSLHAVEEDLDLICLPTGIASHEPLTIEALDAGVNVLVEKPVTGSIASLKRMIDAEKKSRQWIAVGFQDIYSRDIQNLKRVILEKTIGEIVSIKCLGLWPRNDSYYSRNNWAGRIQADGVLIFDSPLNNALAHFVNISLFLGGDVFARSAVITGGGAELYRARNIESFDTASVCFLTERGYPIMVFASHACREKYDPAVTITGTTGKIEWSFSGCKVKKEGKIVYQYNTSGDSRKEMFNAIFDKLEDPSLFSCSLNIAGSHTYCVNLIHKGDTVNCCV